MLDPAFQRKMRRRDAIARVGIVAGGIAVVACVLGIVVQIVGVAAPLFRGPAKRLEADWPLPAEATGEASRVLGVGLDDHLETAYVLLDDGSLVFLDVSDGSVSGRERLRPPGDPSAKVRSAALRPPGDYSLLWSDGSFSLERVAFAPVFDAAGGAGGRAIEPRVTRRMEETFDASRGGDLPLRSIAVAPSEEVGGGGGWGGA